MTKEPPEKLINRQDAAAMLGISVPTLEAWANNKRYDLPYVKIGRLVKYRVSDIEKFIERHTQNNGG